MRVEETNEEIRISGPPPCDAVACILGVSKQRVWQLEQRPMEKLRRQFGEDQHFREFIRVNVDDAE